MSNTHRDNFLSLDNVKTSQVEYEDAYNRYLSYSLDELKKEAKSKGLEKYSRLKKEELIKLLIKGGN